MCADTQVMLLLLSFLLSVYFKKEVEKPKHTNGFGGRERRRDRGRRWRRVKERSLEEEEAEAGGGTKEAWEVLE